MQTSVRVSAALLEELGQAGIAKSRNAALSLAVGRYLADIAQKERIGQWKELGGPLETVSLRIDDTDFQQLKRRAMRGNTSLGGEVTKAAGHALWLCERFGPAMMPMVTNFGQREIDAALFALHDRYTERYEPKGWPTLFCGKVKHIDDEWRAWAAGVAAEEGVPPEEIAKGHPKTRPDWVEIPPRPTREDAIMALRNGEVTVDLPEPVYLDANGERVTVTR